MTQILRAHTALAEYLSLVSSTHVRQLTTICNSSSKGITSFCNPWASALICTHTNAQTLPHTTEKKQAFYGSLCKLPPGSLTMNFFNLYLLHLFIRNYILGIASMITVSLKIRKAS